MKSALVALAGPIILGLCLLGMTGCDPCPSCPIRVATPTPTRTRRVVTPTPTKRPTGTPAPTSTPRFTSTPTSTQTPTTAPTPPPAACSGQGLIGIDPDNNIGYVPIYPLDSKGNAQLAVVDLTVGKASPVLKEIFLTGTQQPMAVAFNPNNKTMLAEGRNSSTTAITVYEIDTTTQSVKNMVVATGLSQDGTGGGIVENATTNKAFVAGQSGLGILDTSKSPPMWDAASVVGTPFMDSFSVNSVTGIMFIASDSSNSIIDTTKSPLAPLSFTGFAVDDGNGFDIATNIALVSQEVGADTTVAMNFATLNTTAIPATADNVLVPTYVQAASPVASSPNQGLLRSAKGPAGRR